MDFNEDLKQYVYEYEGLIFAWDEKPKEDIQNTVKMLADNYYEHLDAIINFMLPDIKEVYLLIYNIFQLMVRVLRKFYLSWGGFHFNKW